MKLCNLCGSSVASFLPYKHFDESKSHFLRAVDAIGSDPYNFHCPNCRCNDRERHLKLYIEALGVFQNVKSMKILHFAPEFSLVRWMRTLGVHEYNHTFADLNRIGPNIENINIESIPYPEATFDLVIANHILEHVGDPLKALSEINRVLTNDGYAILQTPYSEVLRYGIEDPGIEDPRVDTDLLRTILYGQADHVRLFGNNIFEIFSMFLTPLIQKHSDIFKGNVSIKYGVNKKEPFFLFGKKLNLDT